MMAADQDWAPQDLWPHDLPPQDLPPQELPPQDLPPMEMPLDHSVSDAGLVEPQGHTHAAAADDDDTLPVPVPITPEQIAARALAVTADSGPLEALPAGTDGEISFISGISAAGRIAATTFATWNRDNPATYGGSSFMQKWGGSTIGTAGGTISYWFDAASAWTATEQAALQSCMALWSSVANINFTQAASEASASFRYVRGTTGAFASRSGYYATIGGTTTGAIVPGSAYISINTNVTGFGPIGGSFDVVGGYPWMTAVHEIGHLIGLGHGGPYNGSVLSTQQFSVFDTRLWSVMSYIDPTATVAQYYSSYPVTGTDWGYSPDFYSRQPVTPMILDILAIQRIYGAPVGGPLSGGQTYGFNTNIAGPIHNFEVDPIRRTSARRT